MKIKKLMIITGGTGGHIFPGLVIAEYFLSNGCDVKWIGSSNRLEYILLSKYNIKVDYLDIPILNNLNFIKNIFNIIKILYIICKKIKSWKPDLVLGFGGYISFYGILSSWLCKIPTMIHEQNSVVGLSNKILYYISTKVVQAFPNTFNSKRVTTVGNPIRRSILSIKSPNERFKNRNSFIRVLILGGSQGSNIINNIIFKIVKLFKKKKFSFLHQIGIKNYNNYINYKKKYNLNNYICISFINNIKRAYIWADLIISRSGALTISEISTIGLASILIPYLSKDNHQYFNAKYLANKNAAIIIDEKKLNYIRLSKTILSLNRKKLLYMSNMAFLNRINNSNDKFINEIYKI